MTKLKRELLPPCRPNGGPPFGALLLVGFATVLLVAMVSTTYQAREPAPTRYTPAEPQMCAVGQAVVGLSSAGVATCGDPYDQWVEHNRSAAYDGSADGETVTRSWSAVVVGSNAGGLEPGRCLVPRAHGRTMDDRCSEATHPDGCFWRWDASARCARRVELR
jgi:hypothetical protein